MKRWMLLLVAVLWAGVMTVECRADDGADNETEKTESSEKNEKKDKKEKKFMVHRLVAMAFIPIPNSYPQINHKDEVKNNNCVDNLEWCTEEYNANYGTRTERIIGSNKSSRG